MDPLLARLTTSNLKYPDLAKQLVQEVGNSPEKFTVFLTAMLHPDTPANLARHAAGITEKVARRYPYLLITHEKDLVAALPRPQTSVMRWHLALLLSYLPLKNEDLLAEVLQYVQDWLQTDSNKFMKVHCLQVLANISRNHNWLQPETILLIKTEMAKGGAAANAKGRKLLKQLQA